MGTNPGNLFAAYYDNASQRWVPVGGIVDPQRHVIVVQTTHASSWGAWTWIADALIQGIVAGFKLDFGTVLNATQAFAGCADSGTNLTVIIDESANKDYLGSCIEGGDAVHAKLRIVNRRTFFTRVTALAGSAPSDFKASADSLAPLGRQSFSVDFSASPVAEPFVLRAQPDIPYTLANSILQLVLLLPGAKAAFDANTTTKAIKLIMENQHIVAAGLKLAAGDGPAFVDEFNRALAELPRQILDQILSQAAQPGSLLAKSAGFISTLFSVTQAGGVFIQLEDLSASALKGPGEVKFYSNRPIVSPTLTPPPPAPMTAPSSNVIATHHGDIADIVVTNAYRTEGLGYPTDGNVLLVVQLTSKWQDLWGEGLHFVACCEATVASGAIYELDHTGPDSIKLGGTGILCLFSSNLPQSATITGVSISLPHSTMGGDYSATDIGVPPLVVSALPAVPSNIRDVCR